MAKATPEQRFWMKVDKAGPIPEARSDLGPCWMWTGVPNGRGYGHFRNDGHKVAAHRFVYELLVGPIPEWLELDHLCRIRHCVNPEHLEPVTKRENIVRGESFAAVNAAKTHCKRGHLFDEANTYRWHDYRICRACRRARQQGLA